MPDNIESDDNYRKEILFTGRRVITIEPVEDHSRSPRDAVPAPVCAEPSPEGDLDLEVAQVYEEYARVSRFSPVAMSLAALRLLHPSRL